MQRASSPSPLTPRLALSASPVRWARGAVALALGLLLAACANVPPLTPPASTLLHDELFEPASVRADPADVFALTPAMRAFADAAIGSLRARQDARRALIAALYDGRQLQLRYDAGSGTRNAAEAYEARAGNCLSLVIMTSAFAKYLGLPVSYRRVNIDASYALVGGLAFASGHVNVVLSRPLAQALTMRGSDDDLVVDFLPAAEIRHQRSAPIDEQTVLAMYFNNRAAEALAEGRFAESYRWLRAALAQNPRHAPAVNTLAVLYARAGHLQQAEAALRHVLAADPDETAALSNLAGLLRKSGRIAEADAAAVRLTRLQPHRPFHHYELGRRAMDAGAWEQALGQAEVHYWAALAAYRLGDADTAASHLQQAAALGSSPRAQQLYAAKLGWLRAQHLQ